MTGWKLDPQERAMPRLYLDCDGVLADFDHAAKRALGMAPRVFQSRYGLPEFWKRLARVPEFHARLPLMLDAMQLFDAVRHLDPIILIGCPRGGWAERQKERWVATHFPGTPMITCMAVDKRRYADADDILVDDTLKHRPLWEAVGGIFVHHRSAGTTLAELAELGLPIRKAQPEARAVARG